MFSGFLGRNRCLSRMAKEFSWGRRVSNHGRVARGSRSLTCDYSERSQVDGRDKAPDTWCDAFLRALAVKRLYRRGHGGDLVLEITDYYGSALSDLGALFGEKRSVA